MPEAKRRVKQPPKLSADALFAKADKQWDSGRLRSAFRLFLSGAKAGDSGAQLNVGYFYDIGIGVKRNRKAALRWYHRAFRRGSAAAASNIGTIFRDERKIPNALSWFHKAINMGDGNANLQVAKIYLREKGDTKKAITYLKRTIAAKRSTEASEEEAQRLLKQLEQPHKA